MSDTTKPGFTPGPLHWFFTGDDEDREGWSLCSQDGDCSPECPKEPHCHRCVIFHAEGILPEYKPLIAAAPDQNAALQRVAAALVASSHSEKYVSEDDWNPDAHVEIVLTIADARAVYAAIAKAEGKVTG